MPASDRAHLTLPTDAELEGKLAAARLTMDALVTVIKLHRKPLMGTMKHEIDNEEYRLEHRLAQLVQRSRLEEMQLKIASMQEVVTILKRI